jgi:hypothetical protein
VIAVDSNFLVNGPNNRASVLKNICHQYAKDSRHVDCYSVPETLADKEETKREKVEVK